MKMEGAKRKAQERKRSDWLWSVLGSGALDGAKSLGMHDTLLTIGAAAAGGSRAPEFLFLAFRFPALRLF
jgi:hypothetical protein